MFHNIQEVETFFDKRTLQGIKPGLSRMEKLLAYVNNPEQKVQYIHIAGTNGKGSTIQFIKQGLMANDYRVGVFSSPSLEGLLGHIAINNTNISEKNFITLLNKIMPKINLMDQENNSPTEFEIITTIAFMYFVKYVSLAIIETGMGGKDDTTNCVKPILSIITNISIDHTQFLGETIDKITEEKAGIIKKYCPVLIGKVNNQSLKIIVKKAMQKSGDTFVLNKDFTIQNIHHNNDEITFDISYQMTVYKIRISSKALFQVENSALAIMSLVILKKRGLCISTEKAIDGFLGVKVPGRFEVIHQNPKVIVDGAHNPAGIKSLIQTLQTRYNNEPKVLVFSAFKDKHIDKMLAMLTPHFNEIILTTFEHPRAATLEELTKYVNKKDERVRTENLVKVIEKLKNTPSNQINLITGSISFIKIVKNYFN